MRNNGLILGLALFMGLVAAYLARDWIQRQAVAVPATTSSIVVAAAPLGFGIALAGVPPFAVASARWARHQ